MENKNTSTAVLSAKTPALTSAKRTFHEIAKDVSSQVNPITLPEPKRQKLNELNVNSGGGFSQQKYNELQKKLKNLKREVSLRVAKWKNAVDIETEKLAQLDDLKYRLRKTQDHFREDEEITQRTKLELRALVKEQKRLEEERIRHKRASKEMYLQLEKEIVDLKTIVKTPEPEIRQPAPRPQISKRYEPVKLPKQLKPCDQILKKFSTLQHAWVFEDPVDAHKYGDYLEIVKQPRCLSVIRKNLYNGVYKNLNQFAKDMRLIWSNARAYNPAGHEVHEWAKKYSDIFEEMFHRKSQPKTSQVKPPIVCPLNPAQINQLQNKLSDLPAHSMEAIIDFLKRVKPDNYEGQDEIQLDLATLSPTILLNLRDIVNREIQYLQYRPNSRVAKRQRLKRQIEDLSFTEFTPSNCTV